VPHLSFLGVGVVLEIEGRSSGLGLRAPC